MLMGRGPGKNLTAGDGQILLGGREKNRTKLERSKLSALSRGWPTVKNVS